MATTTIIIVNNLVTKHCIHNATNKIISVSFSPQPILDELVGGSFEIARKSSIYSNIMRLIANIHEIASNFNFLDLI